MLGNWRAGLQTELDCALHPWPITSVELPGFHMIEPLQNAMKMFRPPALANFGQARAQFFISPWAGKEWLAQGAQVKAGAAGKPYSLASVFDLFNFVDSNPRPIRSCEGLLRRHKVD